MSDKLYNRNDAQKILFRDKGIINDLLLTFAQKLNNDTIISEFFNSEGENIGFNDVYIQEKLPKGWIMQVFGNCFILRYMDCEQGDKTVYVPSISFTYAGCNYSSYEAKIDEEIIDRLPLGFCSCGKKMRPLYGLIKAQKKLEKGGIGKLFGYVQRFIFSIWVLFSSRWRLAMDFNRHPKCL
jgi:hypothetical protein